MAAGYGGRISDFTNKPKSLLEVNGQSILRHTVEMLRKYGIEVCVVVGYKKEMIQKELEDLPVTFVENPFYRITNSIASLWLARNYLKYDDDIILGNADVFYREETLELLLHAPKSKKNAVLLSDRTRTHVGDYFFACDKDDTIKKYGKELAEKERTCEYVGIGIVRKTFLPIFLKQLETLVDQGEYHLWWENVLYSLNEQYPIHSHDVEGRMWGEVDTVIDYQNILKKESATKCHK